MARKRRLPPSVDQFRDRHGQLRTYFRAGKGPRIPLPNDPTSTEFREAYVAASAGKTPVRRPGREPAVSGTIAALVVSYLKSPEYVELRPTTKKGYASRIEAIRTKHGHRTVSGMTAERIKTFFLDPYAGRPGARLDTLKKLRILIRHAIGKGWLTHDPSVSLRRPKTNEVRSWTDQEIGVFEAHWAIGTKQRLAFALHVYTGQRRSDVHRMTWADVNGSTIRVVQQKTGAKLTIAMHSDLRAILAKTPREHVTILNTEFGRPFTVSGYGNWLRGAIMAAGLPLECKPRAWLGDQRYDKRRPAGAAVSSA